MASASADRRCIADGSVNRAAARSPSSASRPSAQTLPSSHAALAGNAAELVEDARTNTAGAETASSCLARMRERAAGSVAVRGIARGTARGRAVGRRRAEPANDALDQSASRADRDCRVAQRREPVGEPPQVDERADVQAAHPSVAIH